MSKTETLKTAANALADAQSPEVAAFIKALVDTIEEQGEQIDAIKKIVSRPTLQ